jgi:hypothetical protein
MVAGVPLYVLGLLAGSFSVAYPLLFVATGIGFAFLGPVVGATQNMMEPRMRASAAAVLLLAMHLGGGGTGPSFTGWASDILAARHFVGDYATSCPAGMAPAGSASSLVAACAGASGEGLRDALILCSLVFLWAAFHSFMAARTIRADLLPRAEPAPIGKGAGDALA